VLPTNSPPRAAGQLPRRRRRALHDPPDVLEGHPEQIVQDEREPLRRRQLLQHHEQGDPDRVGQDGFLLGILALLPPRHRRHRRVRQLVLPPRLSGAQHVEAHTSDDGGQPAAQVLDLARVRAAEAQPRLLHRVLRLAQGAQHPIGHAAQVAPLRLEPLAEPRLVACHIPSLPSVITVTNEIQPM
jgi:hypothetical protein